MTRWLMVLLLAAVSPAWAIDCTNPNNDGLVCLMSDNATQGGCSGGACVRTYTMPGNAARTGTGTISSSGATVTGSGTAFTTELHVGDVLTASGQRGAITAIASNLSLTVAPAFTPTISAGTAFTYTNPIVRWLDEAGNTVAILDSRGLVTFGRAYAEGALTVLGTAETAVASAGKAISLTGGTGGPSDSSANPGTGGAVELFAGFGGSSAFSTRNGGAGSHILLVGGHGGNNLVANGTGGAGGYVLISGGSGGSDSNSGGYGGLAGDVILNGGTGGSGAAGAGAPSRVILRGGQTGSVVGDIVLCDVGGLVKAGNSAQFQMDCTTGDVTQIKNVPVAGLWNVNAFQQANAGGM